MLLYVGVWLVVEAELSRLNDWTNIWTRPIVWILRLCSFITDWISNYLWLCPEEDCCILRLSPMTIAVLRRGP